jgi:hypothetical protein
MIRPRDGGGGEVVRLAAMPLDLESTHQISCAGPLPFTSGPIADSAADKADGRAGHWM